MTHRLIKEGSTRTGLLQGIEYNGWTITSRKGPICNSNEMDNIQKEFGMPPPEMVFGNNHVTLKVKDIEIDLNAMDALRQVDTSADSSEHIKVAYADEWTRKSRHQDVKDVVKPYDWTYTTAYRGTLNDKAVFHEAEEPSIDVARLQKQEPILFYDENILYEDELADNGTTILSVRLRIMPSCFLVLQRLFLRVDDVLFRINDTRIYHTFGTPYVIREYTSKEDHYKTIINKLPMTKGDVPLVNDPNWVSSSLPQKPNVFIREHLIIE
ncbi:type 2a phosphatase activator tip41 [Lichtheimia corymbifera JMRC:FSU:9682]|uniref:Type 2a phosphatase activator tip41 n=1 Tax=Lichtheimia corymbifera JMRC:FSU:9682 TaxID=1263082 RepID=A0A068RS85_9FUNG|nr:type 2a phosphatase activator tip41 [Lichtheimia corymbifera JMRC:FSU:9682]